MTKTQVEVITSVQRRRRWKERIVAAAMESGAVASEVARAAGIHTSQLFRWRQQLCEREQFPAAFNPVAVVRCAQHYRKKGPAFIKSASARSLSTKLQSSQANSGCMRPELGGVLR